MEVILLVVLIAAMVALTGFALWAATWEADNA